MAGRVLTRRDKNPGIGLREVLAVQTDGTHEPLPIPSPPTDVEEIKQTCDSFTLDAFTAADAWELGHLLYARLLPLSPRRPTVISIALATSGPGASGTPQQLFHAAVGSGTSPDNEAWVRRKRATALRFGTSSWLQGCKYGGDAEAFRARAGLGHDEAAGYAIHGGAVPIRVGGVEGVVAVVVVSGLKQHEDHGVIVDVINAHWE